MPRTGRILSFPRQRATGLSGAEADVVAAKYLASVPDERTDAFVAECFSHPESLLAICGLLTTSCSSKPSTVRDEASSLYAWLIADNRSFGLFDERFYFLGESALLTAGASRLLGDRDEADLWLDRAECNFRRTINAAPSLARVACERLSLHYDRRSYRRVFESAPLLAENLRSLGLNRQYVKCRFVEALSLKEAGETDSAIEHFQALRGQESLRAEPVLHGLVLAHLGEMIAQRRAFEEALPFYKEALSVQGCDARSLTTAHIKAAIADGLRSEGRLVEAVESFREAIADYVSLEMGTMVAYLRVVLAETLIAMSHHREAEWELLAALPTIEEQKMAPEGVAAVTLLKESVRRRKTDPTALRELREHLRAKS